MEHEASLTISVEWVPFVVYNETQHNTKHSNFAVDMKKWRCFSFERYSCSYTMPHRGSFYFLNFVAAIQHRRNTKVRHENDFIINFRQTIFTCFMVFSVRSEFRRQFLVASFHGEKRVFGYSQSRHSVHFDNNVKHGTTDTKTHSNCKKVEIAEEVIQFACNTNLKYGQHNIHTHYTFLCTIQTPTWMMMKTFYCCLFAYSWNQMKKARKKSAGTQKRLKMNRKKLRFRMWTEYHDVVDLNQWYAIATEKETVSVFIRKSKANKIRHTYTRTLENWVK